MNFASNRERPASKDGPLATLSACGLSELQNRLNLTLKGIPAKYAG